MEVCIMANLTIKNKELILVDRNELVLALSDAFLRVDSMNRFLTDNLKDDEELGREVDEHTKFIKEHTAEILALAAQDINKAIDLLGIGGEPKHKIL
jgi:hypothetical protein